MSMERRQHERLAGEEYPLRVGRAPAQLLDWSAGGLGVRLRDGVAGFTLGDAVPVSIPSDATFAVAVFQARVQRMDRAAGTLGLAFLEEGEDAVRLLRALMAAAPA